MVVNRNLVCFLELLAILTSSRALFRHQFPTKYPPLVFNKVDPGSPLFLTPYIEKGDIKTAQSLAKVGPLNGLSVLSYSGFLTVNKTYNSNLFFWFFPSQTQNVNEPVLLWLQGGPGGSSMFGLFVENGPIVLDEKLNVQKRKFSWNQKYHVLYIDNPVGTGFSFTDSKEGYARNESDVADNLYEALVQFFQLFPELKNNDFYLTGESYAGKYIPALGYKIHKEPSPKKIHLRGVAIGDGFSDPYSMMGCYADFMYQTGLLDDRQRDYFQDQTTVVLKLILEKQWLKAAATMDSLLDGDLTGSSYFRNVTGLKDYYNYLRTEEPKQYLYYGQFLALSNVRRSIHVGNLTFNEGKEVEIYLAEDFMQSVKDQLTTLMNYYKVMLYSGQLDVIVAVPLTENMIQTIAWKDASEYRRVPRIVWKIHENDTEVAGYVRRVHDFYQVIMRGGGHILPFDQPERSWDMIDRFISNRPFDQ